MYATLNRCVLFIYLLTKSTNGIFLATAALLVTVVDKHRLEVKCLADYCIAVLAPLLSGTLTHLAVDPVNCSRYFCPYVEDGTV